MAERLSQKELTISQLSEIRGEPWTKIIRYVAPFKDQLNIAEMSDNLLDIQVPRRVFINFDFIEETDRFSEDWFTVTAMAREIGVDYVWINRRILFLNAQAEFRLCSNGAKLHFHPDALDELDMIRQQSIVNIDTDKYINLTQLADVVGRHPLWVTNRMDLMDIPNVLGLDATGKSVTYYDVCVLPLLMAEKDKYLAATEDDLTIPMIAELTGKDREWVEAQIEELEVPLLLRRFDKSGRVDICFHSGDIERIIKNAELRQVAPEGWFTENAIVEIVDKSGNWVSRRLEKYKKRAKRYEDSNGVLRRHYPPGVVNKLFSLAQGWNLDVAIKSDPDIQEDQVGKFAQVYKLCGSTISMNGLLSLGATNEDLDEWQDLGLITRWSSGQYYFTKLAERAVERIQEVDTKLNKLQDLDLWLD